MKHLKSEFQSKLPHPEGIVLRPAVSHALKVRSSWSPAMSFLRQREGGRL